MKKNASLIIVAVVTLAIGYLLGANLGKSDSDKTKGDINAVNPYHQLLTAPGDMAFNQELSTDNDAINQTINTLQICEGRMAEFNTLAQLMQTMSANEPDVAPIVEKFLKVNKQGQSAQNKAAEAIDAANKLKAGEKVNLNTALKNATAAYDCLNIQLAMGKEYVEAVDNYLKDKDIKEHLLTASIRDLVAGHCAVNATLTQNDSEIDYWSNVNEIVKSDDMAVGVE